MAAKTELLSSKTLGRIRHIHFVGIGGAGMCGIAEVLLNQGYQVSGSDLHKTAVTARLQKLGAEVLLGHKAAYVDNADVVVISSAIKQENPEVVAARDKRIPVVPRAEMLAELMRFRYGIAVAGTHGKTTTTSLMVSILAEAELDPTFVIGGRLNSIGSNARLGTGQYLVAEADESDASFLFLKPMMAIITNIDADHMETYHGDFARLQETFLQFLQHLPFYGLAALCIDDPVVAEILPKVSRPVLTYGFSKQADAHIVDYQPQGIQSVFSVKRIGKVKDLRVTLNLPGRHNVLNALAAITLATELGVADKSIVGALEKFAGIGRRFQSYGEFDFASGKVLLIDDYGHHPREISSTLEAIRAAWPTRRVVTVFQPHRYSRTKALFNDFTQVLAQTDALLLLEIYAAGEEPIAEINSQTLAANIATHDKVKPLLIPEHNALRATLAEVLQPGDVLLTQGAGNIGNLAAQLAEDFPTS